MVKCVGIVGIACSDSDSAQIMLHNVLLSGRPNKPQYDTSVTSTTKNAYSRAVEALIVLTH